MHLDTYLKNKPRGEASKLAIDSGVSNSQISMIRRDRFWPSRPTWQKIVRATGGQVTPNDHLQLAPQRMEHANGETTQSVGAGRGA